VLAFDGSGRYPFALSVQLSSYSLRILSLCSDAEFRCFLPFIADMLADTAVTVTCLVSSTFIKPDNATQNDLNTFFGIHTSRSRWLRAM
jgi:hypothetical protein